MQRAKLHDLQNRLGFVVALARQVAERKEQATTAATLAAVEQQLEPSRLAREDTLCRESMHKPSVGGSVSGAPRSRSTGTF